MVTEHLLKEITKHEVQKDWASAIKVLKPFKTGFTKREKKINLQYFKLLLDGLQIFKYFLSFYEISFTKLNRYLLDEYSVNEYQSEWNNE